MIQLAAGHTSWESHAHGGEYFRQAPQHGLILHPPNIHPLTRELRGPINSFRNQLLRAVSSGNPCLEWKIRLQVKFSYWDRPWHLGPRTKPLLCRCTPPAAYCSPNFLELSYNMVRYLSAHSHTVTHGHQCGTVPARTLVLCAQSPLTIPLLLYPLRGKPRVHS